MLKGNSCFAIHLFNREPTEAQESVPRKPTNANIMTKDIWESQVI